MKRAKRALGATALALGLVLGSTGFATAETPTTTQSDWYDCSTGEETPRKRIRENGTTIILAHNCTDRPLRRNAYVRDKIRRYLGCKTIPPHQTVKWETRRSLPGYGIDECTND
ncbi:hypothetical protein [Streptoalloteichus hindustanus]|uniref:Secreted protein n=1 Tax=Streptoalloteichus hindustanus TaxID=2017 RepID=A0A1M4XPD6_STRHI|nr:hypothetical protein [Streptoalloteichus hindustanus]SHE95457.1 hypothetical protein SAMN05444320_10275 [Streptoalloteichus hindustanus]